MKEQAERSRRTDWSATRARILGSARTLFGERGYRATTVRDLADHAGLSQMTLHRHFPAKADLFEAAVLLPLGEFVDAYVASRKARHQKGTDTAHDLHIFYDGLLKAILGEEKLLLAALSISEDPDLSNEMRAYVDRFFGKLEGLMAKKVNGSGLDPRIAPRAIIGMALGLASYRRWLFPSGKQPTQEDLVDQMVKLTMWGIAGKAASQRRVPGSDR